MSRHTELRLLDILDAIERIFSYAKGMSYKSFLADQKTQDAIVRNIEIIGEAARGIPKTFRADNPQIPWDEIIGMRNIIVHHYFGILIDVVWDIVKKELPKLKKQIKSIIKVD
ncbi:MAG: DUF86 domain-containing protein [Planctomycetes bacterium]|nr:DUF86 domain-containing protein [Planctomycetota bacterium]MBU1517745.1 DUF86 domain-containing protein [Planctomycetota bacterium]MBU2457839.1 DUF86 domain-containing protein [Planctomycetota bacterium]MBU2596550.1 DUF86 domain-containing protein [Planctomycetota bacterium]